MRSTAKPSGSPSVGRSRPSGEPPGAVLLDANALFLPFRGSLDLAAEVGRWAGPAPLRVAAGTLAELDRLVARGVSESRPARELARRFAVAASSGRGDAGLLALAVARGWWVVTGDRAFQRRLRAAGVTVLAPRGRQGLHVLRPARVPPPTVRVRATVMNAPPVASGRRSRARDAAR